MKIIIKQNGGLKLYTVFLNIFILCIFMGGTINGNKYEAKYNVDCYVYGKGDIAVRKIRFS